MKTIPLFLLVLLLPFSLLQAETKLEGNFTDIISDQEFTDAGLDQLTPEQVDRLNQLMRKYYQEEIEIAREEAKEEAVEELTKEDKSGFLGLEQITDWISFNSPEEIQTRLIGEFRGWDANSIFTFENGQVWRTRQKKKVKYPKKVVNPEVTIYKTLGGYRMRIEGYRQNCAIKRVK